MKDVIIGMAQIVGGGICVAADDGHRVHDVIRSNIVSGKRVIISFSGITRLTTAFLNAAIGQLYGEFREDQLRIHLGPVRDANDRQLRQLKLVVDRAKSFFKSPDASKKAFREATDIDDA